MGVHIWSFQLIRSICNCQLMKWGCQLTSADANRYFWEFWMLYSCLFTINGQLMLMFHHFLGVFGCYMVVFSWSGASATVSWRQLMLIDMVYNFFWEFWVLYGCLFTINGHFGAKLKFFPLSTFDRINLETCWVVKLLESAHI